VRTAKARAAASSRSGAPTFTRATLRYLDELAANNEREWFDANKARYETLVLDPALAFIETMAPRLERISTHFRAVPKRVGGSLMRVYRDTRFSRDKSPYKTNIGIQFRHARGKDVHAPGFYVHIEPGNCFLGAGIWHPEPDALNKIRLAIVADPERWRRSIAARPFKETYTLGGSALARPPRGFSADAPHIEDLKRKDFIAVTMLEDREVVASEFPASVARRLKTATPLVGFLCSALALDF
jgi:uncharacterized protein (TIGR02453 family)